MPDGKRPERLLAAAERRALYAARRYVGLDLEKKFGLRIKFGVYFQDPLIAELKPAYGFDDEFYVPWEPGISDGPTSARFAVVDYNADTGTLTPPAKWDADKNAFVDSKGNPLGPKSKDALQFHQVHVWAVVQNALDYFESGFGLGRKILWGFEGNRLIVVPHAGYGKNAYYDRRSKSLQFYYFKDGERRIDTCLSTDIINHEFGHAVLDGIRPYFIEAISPETAAFHEFAGDLTAILVAFRNNKFRKAIGAETQGNLSVDNALAGIAAEFGRAVEGRDYLRTANNKETMRTLARHRQRPHTLSQVLTGAVFDIIFELSRRYIRNRGHSIAQAFAFTVIRIQQMAIQPLDLLPPVDATFRDYALAMLRAEEIANPTDPDNYRGMMIDIFIKRGVLDEKDREPLMKQRFVFERISNVDVFHDVDSIASSRAEAYRFLDDNRDALFIPRNADVVVADLFTAQKLTREARRLPKQIVLQYVWREDVVLQGPQFGEFNGQTTSLLCGGTLALDENGNVMTWVRKPGSILAGRGEKARLEAEQGKKRLEEFLEAMVQRVKAGRIGEALESPRGMVGGTIPPLTARDVDGALRFELSPHFGIHDDRHDEMGGRQWQIGS
jgi:hypothetical protein